MRINLLRGFLIKILPSIAMLSACGNGVHQEQYTAEMPASTSADTASIVAQVSNAKEVQETLQNLDSELAAKLSQKNLPTQSV